MAYVPQWTCHVDLHETRAGGQEQGGVFDRLLLGQQDQDGTNHEAMMTWSTSIIDPRGITKRVYLVGDMIRICRKTFS